MLKPKRGRIRRFWKEKRPAPVLALAVQNGRDGFRLFTRDRMLAVAWLKRQVGL